MPRVWDEVDFSMATIGELASGFLVDEVVTFSSDYRNVFLHIFKEVCDRIASGEFHGGGKFAFARGLIIAALVGEI